MLGASALMLAASGFAGAQPQPQSRVLEDAAYEDCLALTRRNPEEGFAQAQLWQATGGGLPAAHCAALALVEMKHYADAADRIEQLLPLAEKQAPHLTVALLDQAANAWLLAELPQRMAPVICFSGFDTLAKVIQRAKATAAMAATSRPIMTCRNS